MASDDVERVVLFGSVARGDAVPGSDADLLVVITARSELARLLPIDRFLPLRDRIPPLGLGVDIFALTEAELATSPLRAAVERDGIEFP